MTQSEFAALYQRERPLYDAWGCFVTSQVRQRLIPHCGGVEQLGYFLKIPPLHRTKTEVSLLAKAFTRGNRYADPYAEITDKVGTRFVVLLLSDIDVVKHAVEGCEWWSWSLDRDFEEEKAKEPLLFDYQSVHYVVRSRDGISDGEAIFPEGMPCEVQVRTLMQHAFAELTHDAVYKATGQVSASVRREVAKSMALIETTDGIFREVSMALQREDADLNATIGVLSEVYRTLVGREPDTDRKSNLFLLQQLRDVWTAADVQRLPEFLDQEFPALDRWVQERRADNALFRQPAVMLVYYLARRKRLGLRGRWPLLERDLKPILTDVGAGEQ